MTHAAPFPAAASRVATGVSADGIGAPGEPWRGPGTSRHTMFLLRPATRRNDDALVAWIGAAVARGDKVVAAHRPGAGGALRALLAESGVLVPAAARQVEITDSAALRQRCGSDAARFAELGALAVGEGWRGLAVTADDDALPCLLTDPADRRAHEREVARLTTEAAVRVLCRVDPGARALSRLLELHHRDVDDDAWSAGVRDGRLWVSGDIDASNAARVTSVLCAAVAHGITEIDLSELDFCAVAGVRAFLAAAAAMPAGAALSLVGVGASQTRLFRAIGGRRTSLRVSGRAGR